MRKNVINFEAKIENNFLCDFPIFMTYDKVSAIQFELSKQDLERHSSNLSSHNFIKLRPTFIMHTSIV